MRTSRPFKYNSMLHAARRLYGEIVAVTGLSHFTNNCPDHSEGIGQGYEGELKHVTSQLLALAKATPAA